jgi:CubicO group peptidase (beta-lactamase class C family)
MPLRLVRRLASRLLFLLLLASACGTPPLVPLPQPPQPPPELAPPSVALPTPTTEKLTADAPRVTSEGVTFTAPAGWTLLRDGPKRVLDGYFPDLRVAIVEVGAASSPEAAVANAWPALVPDFQRPIKVATDWVPRYGWDQRKRFSYEASPDERLVVMAQAFRKGDRWTVILVHSGESSFAKREGQVMFVLNSLRPAGYTRETFQGRTAHALDAARVQALKDFVETARTQFGVPGVALSLFTTDSVIFEGGFGVREIGKPAPVDADTLFMIASNTKSLSTLLLAKLVDEGKLTWDTKVTSVYPAFKLGDADLTHRVTLKNLVCMCTGFPPEEDADWLLEFKGSSPKSFVDRLGTMKPTRGFGEAFQYTDLLTAAAGFIGGAVVYPKHELGAAYDEAMKTRVFGPLGMTSTTFDFARALRNNHASPHAEDFSGKPALVAIDVDRALSVPVRPAAGAWSNVKDMRRYVQMELAKGKLPDRRFISEEALLARRVPQIAHARAGETYALALGVNTEFGITYVHNGGDVVGYKTDFFFLPEHGVGGVILTNGDAFGLCRVFIRRTLELLFDGNPEAAEDVTLAVGRHRNWLAKERTRRVLPADPAVVAKLAKRYENPTLGSIVVHTDAKGTVFDFGEWKSTVSSRKNDDGTTTLVPIDPGVGRIDFVVMDQGGRRLILRDAQHEHVFTEAR